MTGQDTRQTRSGPPTGQTLLQIEDLCVDYATPRGQVRAVDHLSLRIDRGEIFGLAGESGSGKSTAAMAALRLLPPPAVITGGQVWFEGVNVFELSEAELRAFRWRKIALVFQSAMNALNPVMSIGAQIRDVLVSHDRLTKRAATERAIELLELVGIDSSRLKSYPHQLSGGMRQRVVIAIALALKPAMLFMDEPTTALDVVVQREILERIVELKREMGFSILLVTHDLGLMLQFCDTVGILYAGRLCEVAPARVLLETPQHPYTKGLLASFPEISGPRHRLPGIPGSPPDMLTPGPGCRFHPRCPEAMPECRTDQPELLETAPQHLSACFRAQPAQSRRTSREEGARAGSPPGSSRDEPGDGAPS